jgi:FtsP/CotA-like multicopper oxidase with cupredoxin domain
MPRRAIDRRGFLGVSASGFLCTIGGREVLVRSPADAGRADDAARAVARPAALGPAEPTGPFAKPAPAPGGRVREVWIQARAVRWDAVPTGRDDWQDVPVRGRRRFWAYAYQRMTAGFDRPMAAPSIPGPLLQAEVGDVLAVHFRNADEHFRQPVTMHPHGLRYTPDYDGTYQGAYTRPAGFVAPGEEVTYLWEATPDAVGVWPYHDHGPNHMLNTYRGLFGAIVVRERGAKAPDVEEVLVLHSLPPAVTGRDDVLHAINGRAYAGNTPTIRARVGQDVALHVIGMDDAWHDFHVHGHRWRDAAGTLVDTPSVGPSETITARFTEDNPGRWLYHCHVLAHQMAGMAGWYVVTP